MKNYKIALLFWSGFSKKKKLNTEFSQDMIIQSTLHVFMFTLDLEQIEECIFGFKIMLCFI